MNLDGPIQQAEFAKLADLSVARVSQLVSEGTLDPDASGYEWMHSYLRRLRESAAGRLQDLSVQRARLAREQRIGQEIKNRVAQREYAPIGLLADVLATASRNVVDRLDALSGTLARTCPGLDDEARTQVLRVIASARNEWVRSTESLAVAALDDLVVDDDDPDEFPPEDGTGDDGGEPVA